MHSYGQSCSYLQDSKEQHEVQETDSQSTELQCYQADIKWPAWANWVPDQCSKGKLLFTCPPFLLRTNVSFVSLPPSCQYSSDTLNQFSLLTSTEREQTQQKSRGVSSQCHTCNCISFENKEGIFGTAEKNREVKLLFTRDWVGLVTLF